jgi:hypothetical protein
VYDYNSIGGNWVQVGNDIEGEAEGDVSGSVAMSKDGSRVAIGARLNDNDNGDNSGHVRVYDYNSSEEKWVQVGGGIEGEAAHDYSGENIAMNEDGSRVAIGARAHDGIDEYNIGQLRVFDYNSNEEKWVQVGNAIEGESNGPHMDYFASSVAMSEDGSRVAIGGPTTHGTGYVRVYDYNSSGNWVKVGGDLTGEGQFDYLGRSVAMNDVGSRVACGATGNDGNGNNSGTVRVYDYNSSGNWVQVGADIDGETSGDHSGGSIAMSKDGSRVAIGADGNDGSSSNPEFRSGHARVFEYNSGQNKWVQVGDDIDGVAFQDSASTVAMSDDGTRVALGAGSYDGINGINTGHVRVFSSIPITLSPTGSPTGSPTFAPANQGKSLFFFFLSLSLLSSY